MWCGVVGIGSCLARRGVEGVRFGSKRVKEVVGFRGSSDVGLGLG